MSSQISSIFNIARSALLAAQTAVQTDSQNISNAQTPGYTRRSVLTEAASGPRSDGMYLGNGVTVKDVSRASDAFADATVRQQTAGASYDQVRSDTLSNIERVLNEPSDGALSGSLDAFWSAWQDLAAHPQSAVSREVVKQTASQVIQTLHSYDGQLAAQDTTTRGRIGVSVDDINNIAKSIASYNRQIQAVEAGGATAGDLRDQRDLAVDKLSAYANVTVREQANHTYTVLLGSQTIVDQVQARTLQVSSPAPPAVPTLFFKDAPNLPLAKIGGSLGAAMDLVGVDIPNLRNQLDALANGLVVTVNGVQQAGALYPPGSPPAPSTTPPPFFDPASTTAHSIALDSSIVTSANNIAVALAGTGPTNNGTALAMGSLGTQTAAPTAGPPPVIAAGVEWPPLSGSYISITEFYRNTVSQVGLNAGDAQRSLDASNILQTQAVARRDSIRGVNIDEEMVNLIKHQQVYTAASKLITTAQQMYDTLLSIGR